MSALAKGTLFPAQLESKIFNLAKGHSSLAKLSGQEALPLMAKISSHLTFHQMLQ